MEKEYKIYNTGFVGAFDSTRRNVKAYTSREAKEYFQKVYGGNAGHIICKKHDVISLNDSRHCIDWYDAENGKEMITRNTGRSSMVMAGMI